MRLPQGQAYFKVVPLSCTPLCAVGTALSWVAYSRPARPATQRQVSGRYVQASTQFLPLPQQTYIVLPCSNTTSEGHILSWAQHRGLAVVVPNVLLGLTGWIATSA